MRHQKKSTIISHRLNYTNKGKRKREKERERHLQTNNHINKSFNKFLKLIFHSLVVVLNTDDILIEWTIYLRAREINVSFVKFRKREREKKWATEIDNKLLNIHDKSEAKNRDRLSSQSTHWVLNPNVVLITATRENYY